MNPSSCDDCRLTQINGETDYCGGIEVADGSSRFLLYMLYVIPAYPLNELTKNILALERTIVISRLERFPTTYSATEGICRLRRSLLMENGSSTTSKITRPAELMILVSSIDKFFY